MAKSQELRDMSDDELETKLAEAKGRAAHWMELNKKYRPLVEAMRSRPAA